MEDGNAVWIGKSLMQCNADYATCSNIISVPWLMFHHEQHVQTTQATFQAYLCQLSNRCRRPKR